MYVALNHFQHYLRSILPTDGIPANTITPGQSYLGGNKMIIIIHKSPRNN